MGSFHFFGRFAGTQIRQQSCENVQPPRINSANLLQGRISDTELLPLWTTLTGSPTNQSAYSQHCSHHRNRILLEPRPCLTQALKVQLLFYGYFCFGCCFRNLDDRKRSQARSNPRMQEYPSPHRAYSLQATIVRPVYTLPSSAHSPRYYCALSLQLSITRTVSKLLLCAQSTPYHQVHILHITTVRSVYSSV